MLAISTWQSFLSDERRRDALAIARSIAGKLTDPARLAFLVAEADARSEHPESTGWQPASLSRGDAGLALALGHWHSCFPGDSWEHHAHRHLEIAARAVAQLPELPLGMFGGLSGVGLAAHALAAGRPRYRKLLASIDDRLFAAAHAHGESLVRRRATLRPHDYDLVAGLGGIATYVLSRPPGDRRDAALAAALRALVALAEGTRDLPGWAIAPTAYESELRRFEHGFVDCGLAHGVPGALAVMSLAYAQGARVEGLAETIARDAHWLLAHRHDDEHGTNWPKFVPLPLRSGTALGPKIARAGWCYGAPGIARALWMAGRALDDARLRDAALEAMRSALRRPEEARGIDSPMVCHGLAGLLLCALRFANETGDADIVAGARAVASELVDAHDPSLELGYRNVELGGARLERPGLVNGSCGVMLALAAAATEVAPAWDRALLLS